MEKTVDKLRQEYLESNYLTCPYCKSVEYEERTGFDGSSWTFWCLDCQKGWVEMYERYDVILEG